MSTFVTLPATKLSLSLRSGGSDCSAMCFTHLRDNNNDNDQQQNVVDHQATSTSTTMMMSPKPKSEFLIEKDEAAQRDALFSCLGWFANSQPSNRHCIDVIQVRNTEIGTLHASPFSETTVRLDEALFVSSNDESDIKIHSLVPCYRFGYQNYQQQNKEDNGEEPSSSSSLNGLHDEFNNKSVVAVACVISSSKNIKKQTASSSSTTKVVFLVPSRNNNNNSISNNYIDPQNSKNGDSNNNTQTKREQSFKTWLETSTQEESRKRQMKTLRDNNSFSTSPTNNDSSDEKKLRVQVSEAIPLGHNEVRNPIVSVKDATGASEDVTLWVSKFAALLVGCEGGKIFAVVPSSSSPSMNNQSQQQQPQQQQQQHLVFNDDSAGAIVQIAECNIHQNLLLSKDPSSAMVCSFVVSCISKSFILEVQMKVSATSGKCSFQILSNKSIGTKARVGVYGGCSLAPLKDEKKEENEDDCEQHSSVQLLPSTTHRLDAAITLALRPNLRMFLCDSTTGNVKQTLPLPQNPRVPGIRSLRDITKQVDRRIFTGAANPPSCLALCVARNQVSLLDVFSLKYVAVQQLTSDVLTALQEDANKAQEDNVIDEYASVPESARAATSSRADASASARTTGRGGGGNAASSLDQALMAKGPHNVKSVQIVMGVFLVILLQSGEVNVVSMGKVTREFCEALMVRAPRVSSKKKKVDEESPKEVEDNKNENEADVSPEKAIEEQTATPEKKALEEAKEEPVAVETNETVREGREDATTTEQKEEVEQTATASASSPILPQEPEQVVEETLSEEQIQQKKEDDEFRQKMLDEERELLVQNERQKKEAEEEKRKRQQAEIDEAAARVKKEQQQAREEEERKKQQQQQKAATEEKERQRQKKLQKEIEDKAAKEKAEREEHDRRVIKEQKEKQLLQQQEQEERENQEQEKKKRIAAEKEAEEAAKQKKDDIEEFIERCEADFIQYDSNSDNNNLKNNVPIEAHIMQKTFFSLLLDISVRLCARVRGLNQQVSSILLANKNRINSSSNNIDNDDDEENNNNNNSDNRYSKIRSLQEARIAHTIGLCRNFSKILPDLSRFAQVELSKPLSERRLDSNMFRKEEVKRRLAAIIMAPLCFFEYSNLHESFKDMSSIAVPLEGDVSKDVAANITSRGSNSSSSKPNAFAQTESPEDIAFANATRATFKLLRSLKLVTWPVASVLIYLLHRRRSLSMSMSLMKTFEQLGGAVGSEPTSPITSSASQQSQSIAGDYLRKKPLPGSEPLITRSSRHQPLPHLLSAAMMIARRVVEPTVPFFGATVVDAQEDTLSQTPSSGNASSDFCSPPKTHATASTGAQIDFENLSKNVEKSIFDADGKISDFFPALPDVFTRASSNSKSSLTLIRNFQAVSQSKQKQQPSSSFNNSQQPAADSMFYEYYGDDNDYDASFGDDEEDNDNENKTKNKLSADVKSSINIFEACYCDPDAVFVDYSVHTILTLVYLPFINIVLPTKATIAAWTQLAWDSTFDQQWIEWSVTCPRLREDIFNFFMKKLPKDAVPPTMQKRLPSGMTMSAVLCDQILPYLVQLRGDPRANLCLSPILRGGITGLSVKEKQSSARAINHWEIDVVLVRRLAWCLHVFLFEYASIISKLNHELEKNQKILMEKQLQQMGGTNNNNDSSSSKNNNNSDRYALDNTRGSIASTSAMSYRSLQSASSNRNNNNNNSSSSNNKGASSSPPEQSHLAIQRRLRRLRQTDAWIEELIAGLKTCFGRDRSAYNSLLRGLSELACAFNHGRALVDLEGFNSVVDRLVAIGDVGALFPIIQYMDESHLTSREWTYIFLVSKGAGLLRDAVHLSLAIQQEQGPSGIRNVKNLVIQAFPSLRWGNNNNKPVSSGGDPQLNDVLDMLQKLGA